MKYANYIILFIFLSLFYLFQDHIRISSNLLSLFASKETLKKIKIAENLGLSKEMFIASKGFDKASKEKIIKISEALKNIEGIKSIQSTVIPSIEVQNYYKLYYPILATFDNQFQTDENIKSKLQSLYDEQFTNVFYKKINKEDPLNLFNIQQNNEMKISSKGKYLTLKNYGYLLRIHTNVSPAQMKEAKLLYGHIHNVLNDYEDILSFASFYYTVENSKIIQKDIELIILFSTIILLIIYYLVLRNIKLLMHTMITLFSSILFAGLVVTVFFNNFHILSLAFGTSLSAVSIDYLLHYYFHNFYQNTQKIDKNVLYGFITTIIAFGILSFIPILLISQISVFAVLSISFAYFIFTFIFPKLGIDEYEGVDIHETVSRKIPAYVFFMLSIAFFTYTFVNINLDFNIRNLDYQNAKLQEIEKIIQGVNSSNMFPVIVQAKTKQELIKNLHLLKSFDRQSLSLASFITEETKCIQRKELLMQYDFNRVNQVVNAKAQEIGFKEDYFKDSYKFMDKLPSCEVDNLEIFEQYNLSVFEDEKIFYTVVLVSDVSNIDSLKFVSVVNPKEIFLKQAREMYQNLLFLACFVIIVILMALIYSVRKKILYALNFIIFPVSFTLAVLINFMDINIMHLFSLIILIAIGIDFGIYMSNSTKISNTTLAIKYSILSTFAAFGVLIFSSITALNSIGSVITVGIGAIYLLTKVMK